MGSPRLNTRVNLAAEGLSLSPALSCWAWRPRLPSRACWSLRLSRSTTSPASSLPMVAGPPRSSTIRLTGPGFELRTWSSWGLASSRLSRLPSRRRPTPMRPNRLLTSTATSSSRLRWALAGTLSSWPNHSSSRAPSLRLRLVTPSWFSSTSRGIHSCWGVSPKPLTQSQRALWSRPLMRILLPWRSVAAAAPIGTRGGGGGGVIGMAWPTPGRHKTRSQPARNAVEAMGQPGRKQ